MQWSPIRLNLSEDQDGEIAVNLQPKNGVNSSEMEKAKALSTPPNDKQLMKQMKKTPLAPRVHRGCVSRNQPAAISGPEMEKMQSSSDLQVTFLPLDLEYSPTKSGQRPIII